jgi:DNA repair protein RecO (recombination protein O)
MLVGGLQTLASSSSPLVVPAFFWKLLAAEGLRPELDRCVRCGATEALIAFELDEGGVLCRGCRQGVGISAAGLALLRQVLGGQLQAALDASPSPATAEVAQLATRALEHHLERRLRTVALLEGH